MRVIRCAVLSLAAASLAPASAEQIAEFPSDPNARSGAAQAQLYSNLLFEESMRAYDATDGADPKWDTLYEEAARLLADRSAARPYAFPDDIAETQRAIAAAYDAGCREPLILDAMFRASAADPDADRDALLRLIDEAAEATKAPSYPPLARFQIADMQAAFSRAVAPERTAELEEAALDALRDAARRGAIPTETPTQQRRVVALATLHRQSNPSGDYPADVYKALRSIKGIHQWTRRLLDAVNEVDLAWQARGAKFAHLTPDEQLREFERRLRTARGHLVAAHRLHPERPEAAAMMIKITLGLGESATKDIHYWFEQAVNAEIDWVDTYVNYDWAIRPRWGGSHEQMIAFGEAAWDTQRFDTFVPLIRVWMHTRVGLDSEELKAVWHDPDTLTLGTTTIKTLLARPEWRERQNYLQTIRASMCYWGGDWDQFKIAWAALERDNGKAILEPDALAFMAQKDHWLRYSANHFNIPE